jgi:hypothetical protein
MANKSPRFVPRSAELRDPFDRTWARCEFLRAIGRRTPEVLKDLYASVYQPHAAELRAMPSAFKLIGPGADPDDRDRVTALLHPRVAAWATRWHLAAPPMRSGARAAQSLLPWLEWVVLDTLLAWQGGLGEGPPDWALPTGLTFAASLEVPTQLVITLDGWALLGETEGAFRTRAGERFQRELDRYVAGCREAMADWPAQNPSLPPGYFDALALYQVRGLSISRIADELDFNRRTISDGVRQAAAEVVGENCDRWLRPPGRGGRPKGARTSANPGRIAPN